MSSINIYVEADSPVRYRRWAPFDSFQNAVGISQSRAGYHLIAFNRALAYELTMKSESPHRLGLHTIALFEAAKAVAVLCVGLGLLPFIHQDLQDVGDHIVEFLHLDPAHRLPGIFLRMLDRAPDIDVIWVSLGAFAYSALRLIEAYGLWKDRLWAEWAAIIAGGMYLPFEIYEAIEKFSFFKLAVVIGNALIVVYLLSVRHAKLKNSLPIIGHKDQKDPPR